MRRLLIITAALAVALWAAPAAGAKGLVEKVEVCGQDGDCAAVAAKGLKGWRGMERLLNGPARTAPDTGRPFYRLEATMGGGDGGKLTVFYVPGGLVTSGRGDGWRGLPAGAAAEVDRVAATIEPLRDEGVARVTVNDAPVADATPYAAIFADLPAAGLSDAQVNVQTLVRISVENVSESPWTGSRYHFALYDPGHGAVQVSGAEWVTAPVSLQTVIQRDVPRAAPAAATSSGVDFPAVPVALAIAGALGLGALLIVLVRRRRYAHTLAVREGS